MDNNPSVYNNQAPIEGVSGQHHQVPVQGNASCSVPPQQTAPVYGQYQSNGINGSQYPQGYVPVGYNVPVQQPPAGAYTPQPQYYQAPVQVNPYYVAPVQQSPATIYYNNQVVGVPQYHYGNPMYGSILNNNYYMEQQKRVAARRDAEKKYREAGNVSGIVAIVCYGLALLFSLLFLIDGVSKIYDDSLVGMSLINMFYTLVVVGGSFFALKKTIDNMGNGRALKLENKQKESIPLDFTGPKDFRKSLLIILIGLGGCMLANYVSSALLAILEGFGIYSNYTSLEDPQSVADVVALFLSVAIMPALIEEISLRGILMTPMRKLGNGFAILASAYIFGVFHGDAAQIPFAFVCGLFFGYAVIVTGSIWPAVIIHGLNNSLSCISSVLVSYVSEDAGNIFYYACTIGFILIAVIALYFYLKKYKDDFALIKEENKIEDLTFGKKFGKFITSPGIIIMTVLYVIRALSTLTTTPPIK